MTCGPPRVELFFTGPGHWHGNMRSGFNVLVRHLHKTLFCEQTYPFGQSRIR
jgi:hypothetical protein